MKRTLIHTSLALASGALALAGCQSPPEPNANLNQATAAYSEAQNDPMAQRSASHELEQAQEYLKAAQDAWSKKKDKADVDTYAYISQRHSEMAQLRGKTRTAALATTASARTLTLPGMLFATGKADLNADGRRAIDQLATYLKEHPDQSVSIVGHTDSTGSKKINAALSARRAASVQTALVDNGIDPSRIQARGVGPAEPVSSNNTAAGRQKNRRVEVAISPSTTEAVGSTTPP